MAKKILIVDDEQNIVDILKFNLRKEGYETIEAYDGEEAVRLCDQYEPDLILLDVMLPKMDGFSVCRKIREKSNVPIIMLTAREEEFDQVLGLELGADDYITKPPSIRVLLSRIKSNLRRTEIQEKETESLGSSAILHLGKLEIDTQRFEIRRNGEDLHLTIREYELVKFLAEREGQIFTREQLLKEVWGYEFPGDKRTVDVTVARIREKIEDESVDKGKYIHTKRGIGYYIKYITD
ncbi:MAG: response regulator [Clostridia bacterium]|mgnify:FL=1|jgi:two-component system response regulator VicR|nr:response regulator transcription factor [Clostridiaceae bacterium]